MSDAVWAPVTAALDRAATAGRTVDVWLRDDDAITMTPALDRLAALNERHQMPVLLAVIPAGADELLARFVENHTLFTPTQHGYAHTNHAAAGERARELGGTRPLAEVIDDLARGRDRLARLFGPRMASILVPPWNRIDAAVVEALPGLGFEALSTFGPPAGDAPPGLAVLNADLDPVDWRHGRGCRPMAKLVVGLAELIDRGSPIGLLAHHLAHDEDTWVFVETCIARLASHPAVRFSAAETFLLAPEPIVLSQPRSG